MNPFRVRGVRPVEVEEHPDPFPSVACADCGAPTVSVEGEACCARCDLRNLAHGVNVLRNPVTGKPERWLAAFLPWFPSWLR